jgi:dipeptidase E
MKFFLASRINDPEALKKLRVFLGKDFKGLSVCFIPTAARGEFYDWENGGTFKTIKELFKSVKVVSLEDSHKMNVIDQIKGHDILWLSGGMPGYLLYWIRRSGLDKALSEILNSGTVYVGSSASSSVLGPSLHFAEIPSGDNEPGASLIPGLGYLEHEFIPHFEDKYLEFIKQHYRKGKAYLMKDHEAITIDNGRVEILGEKRIITGK